MNETEILPPPPEPPDGQDMDGITTSEAPYSNVIQIQSGHPSLTLGEFWAKEAAREAIETRWRPTYARFWPAT